MIAKCSFSLFRGNAILFLTYKRVRMKCVHILVPIHEFTIKLKLFHFFSILIEPIIF